MSSAIATVEFHISLGRENTEALRIAQGNNNPSQRRKITQADKLRTRLFFYEEAAATNILTPTDFAGGTTVAFGAVRKDGDGTELITCNTFARMDNGLMGDALKIWYEAIVNADTTEVNALFATVPTAIVPIYCNVQVSDVPGGSATERGTKAWFEADLLPDAYKDGSSVPTLGTTWGYYVPVPASHAAAGEVGMQAVDPEGNFIYIAVAHNKWRRAVLNDF